MFKLGANIQKELDQKIQKSKQSEFINQAILFALKKLPQSNTLNLDFQEKKDSAYFVYSDGGARGNPGIAGCGVVVFDAQRKKVATVKYFIKHATNNEAEYQALFLGVKKVLEFKPHTVDFYLDSELIVKQMQGIYKVKKPALREFYTKINLLLQKIPQVRFVHIPREQNKLADKLANEAMDCRNNFA